MTDYKKAFVDTAPFIYFIEKDQNNPQYYDKVKSFFSNGYEADKKFVTSVITMEEYFVFPYRNKLYSFIDMFDRLVETTGMEIIEVNQEIAKKAAQIRAEYKGFKAMDAIQLAVACLTKCDLIQTKDKQLRQFNEIKCITVDELDNQTKNQRKETYLSEGAIFSPAADCGYYQQLFLILLYANGCG